MSFIGELSPLILGDINDQWLLIPFLVVVLCVSLYWVFLAGVIFTFFRDAASFLGLGFPSLTFCRAGFVDMHCLNLFLSWNILCSSLMVIERLADYSGLWFLSVFSTSIQNVLAFMVYIEKLSVILIGLPIYVT